MDNMEDKLNAILKDPNMMRQLQSMAQSLGLQSQGSQSQQKADPPPPRNDSSPEFDPVMLQKLSGFAQQSGVDRNQRALLTALGPYLSRERIAKLEKAMRAAKMARLASGFLGQGGLSLLTGR